MVIPPISIIKYVKFESGLPVLTIKHPTARQQADFDQYKRAEVAEEAYKELLKAAKRIAQLGDLFYPIRC